MRQALRTLWLTTSAAAWFASAGVAHSAQPSAAPAYPTKPVRLIVPFAPGGAADILARVVAKQLQRELGKPIVLVNREGAGTIIGVEAAAKAAPDGYTLLFSGDAATINTASARPLPYDLMRDLKPVTLVFSSAQFVVVGAKDTRFASMQDLIRYAKANPGALKFGTSGVATSTHLSTETINAAAGITADSGTPRIVVVGDNHDTRTMFPYLPGVANELERIDATTALVTLCAGGALAPATVIERM